MFLTLLQIAFKSKSNLLRGLFVIVSACVYFALYHYNLISLKYLSWLITVDLLGFVSAVFNLVEIKRNDKNPIVNSVEMENCTDTSCSTFEEETCLVYPVKELVIEPEIEVEPEIEQVEAEIEPEIEVEAEVEEAPKIVEIKVKPKKRAGRKPKITIPETIPEDSN